MTSIAPVVTLSPRDYDAVLFDLDGVLTKTASGFCRKVRFLGKIQKSVLYTGSVSKVEIDWD